MNREPLRAPLKEHLRGGVDELRVERLWRERVRRKQGIERTPASRMRRPVWMFAAMGAAVAMALAATMWLVVDRPGALELDGAPLAGARRADVVESFDLDDGSRITLAQGSRFEVRANDGERFETTLLEGEVRLAVTPGGPRRWSIDAGIATVVVVGTELAITKRLSATGEVVVGVEVFKGRVLVQSARLPGGERSVGAGESVVVESMPSRAPTPEQAPTQAHTPTQAPAPEQAPTPTPTQAPAPTQAPTPTQAHTHEQAPAPTQAPTPKQAHAPAPTPTPDALLAMADSARADGDPRTAASQLEAFLDRFPDHVRAPIAAFTLARLEADTLGRPARAATRLAVVLDRLPAPLVPDALARLAQAHHAAGDLEHARTAALRYLSAYPDGARARAMRALAYD